MDKTNVSTHVAFDDLALAWNLYDRVEEAEKKALQRKMELINEELAKADEASRLKLATGLLKLWCGGSYDELRGRFGDCWKLKSICKAMLSVSGDGRQLRVWYSFPKKIEYDHVDSCGRGLLFGVYGQRSVVSQYLEAFLGVERFVETRMEKGVRLFISL